MNNSDLVSRIASALIKGDMYERVSFPVLIEKSLYYFF